MKTEHKRMLPLSEIMVVPLDLPVIVSRSAVNARCRWQAWWKYSTNLTASRGTEVARQYCWDCKWRVLNGGTMRTERSAASSWWIQLRARCLLHTVYFWSVIRKEQGLGASTVYWQTDITLCLKRKEWMASVLFSSENERVFGLFSEIIILPLSFTEISLCGFCTQRGTCFGTFWCVQSGFVRTSNSSVYKDIRST